MNRIVLILVVAAAMSSAAVVVFVNSGADDKPALSEDRRAVRERFFGSGKELPLIKDGQEMRPRW